MTYCEFHLVFNLPLILLLLWLARKRLTRTHWKWIGVVILIVLVFAIPWDSWAVHKKIWDFNGARIAMRIGMLPVEEYLFFVLATVEASLLTILFLPNPRKVPVSLEP